MSLPAAEHPYAEFLARVEKPARYSGGEVGSVRKDWGAVEATFCLAFPDVYDIGMSHLGFKILYGILNDDPRTLAERCYAPWVDVERELRARGLPLVSLESKRPLRDFDVVGFSLQFELTYTNVLQMLDLGGIPLRSADRGEADPLVVAGGPTATHPEPLAPFVDAFVIGDGEEKATEVALTWARLRREGAPRRERLIALARLGSVYVPSLYETRVDPETGLEIVQPPTVEGAPFPVGRSLVDLDRFPFPASSPTGGPEAIFDRVSIEIARGCTEGCRFCQAGMIYRPVRERDPEQVVDTVVRAVRASGQDEASLTALSTADVSCINPLITKVARRLAEERVSLGVSSLRAYGLEPELLDELKRVRATGLTFAPEAGSPRMRDVVNKNVTEEQLQETAERVFSRGWTRMKLYFMLGLPTETDDDVRGIVETGARTAAVGRKAAGKPVDVTVSVSTHVPKPHTPFQWCAMDSLAEIERKQELLRAAVRPHRAVSLRTHDASASVLEGIFARGDRRLGAVLEDAYRAGARFDSWDEQLRLDVWDAALDRAGIERSRYLGTLPVKAPLPWSHIDVGLEDGFLAREYRKAMQSRLSPPCGKVAGTFVHHTNVADAKADERRLVCYDCGVACDMTRMREERVEKLVRLGAAERRAPEPAPEPAPPPPSGEPAARPPRFGPSTWVRLELEKVGPMVLLGHLDAMKEIPRILRRLGLRVAYSAGFHPKPDMSFSPALSLGVASLAECVDVRLEGPISAEAVAALPARMTAASPEGLVFVRALSLGRADVSGHNMVRPVPLSRLVEAARYVVALARSSFDEPAGAEQLVSARAEEAMAAAALPVRRVVERAGKTVDVRAFLRRCELGGEEARALVRRAGLAGDVVLLDCDVTIGDRGSAKIAEVVHAVLGPLAPAERASAPLELADAASLARPHRAVRAELFRVVDGARKGPFELDVAPAPPTDAHAAASPG